LQENTEATDADLLRKTNPFLAKLLTTHLSSDKAAKALAGLSEHGKQCFLQDLWWQLHASKLPGLKFLHQ